MSFKTAIEKIKFMFATQKTVAENMEKHEEYLHKATNDTDELRIAVNGKVVPCICVFIAPGYDIDHVQELYANVGINLEKHILRRGNRNQNVLYIPASEYGKLDPMQQRFFKRTTINRPIYKQNLSYATAKDKVK